MLKVLSTSAALRSLESLELAGLKKVIVTPVLRSTVAKLKKLELKVRETIDKVNHQ